jgi:hypothetical protein
MILFRTSSPKRRISLSFLSSLDEQVALLRQLEVHTWIEEIFQRTLPIPPAYQTRFGPPGFTKNPFYASERRETTFFEFGYGLLKRPSLTGLAISAVCYEILFSGAERPLDAAQTSKALEILNPKTYDAAHQWVQTLNPLPEAIRYPAVREPDGGGINFAIYERPAVVGTTAQIEEVTMTPDASGGVTVQNLITNAVSTIFPIR